MFKHILLPTDGSDLAGRGVKETIAMAKTLGAQITAVHVVRRYHVRAEEGYSMPEVSFLRERFESEATAHAKELLESIREEASKAGIACDTVVAKGDSPYREIIAQAKAARCDLIVMASHCRRGFGRLLHGSETTNVLTHSTIPVLVVH